MAPYTRWKPPWGVLSSLRWFSIDLTKSAEIVSPPTYILSNDLKIGLICLSESELLSRCRARLIAAGGERKADVASHADIVSTMSWPVVFLGFVISDTEVIPTSGWTISVPDLPKKTSSDDSPSDSRIPR